MTEISDQVVEVIREAIRLEINGRAFFLHAEVVTHNELGKRMFKRLAEDEVRHLDTFSQLFSEVISGDEWKRLVKEEELKGPSPLIEQLKLKLKKGEKAGELEAMSIGMELERNAVAFFKKSSKEATDPKAKQIFDEICEEEKLHYVLLQAQYDSVSKNGCWLDVAEFRMDGKF
jgi:rubrerythrin